MAGLDNNLTYNEKELFVLIAEGDEDAFNRFYETLMPHFAAYIFKLVKSQEAVSEVIQESLIRLWLNREKLIEIEQPRAWFIKILSNECYRYLRKHGLQQLPVHMPLTIISDTETERYISYKETQTLICKAVSNLSPRQRTIYQLSREEGLKLPEIAAKLGLSRDYVKKVLMTALGHIRQRLAEDGRLPVVIILLLLK